MIRDLFITTFVAAFCLTLGMSTSAQTSPSYKITGLKIVNYNQYDHIFKDVSDEKDYEYWNALGTSVIVSAIVSGAKHSYVPGRKVQFKVYAGERLVQTHIGSVGYIRSGTYYVPMVLYGPLCRSLKIEARILGQKEASAISQTLKIDCGE